MTTPTGQPLSPINQYGTAVERMMVIQSCGMVL